MRRHRIWPLVLVIPGLLLIAGSFGFKSWMLPELKKFPTDLAVDAAYEGTVTLYVDPATKQPLAEPQVLPLSVSRQVESVAEESDGDTVVVRETLRLESPGLFDSVQLHQYVMDRTTAVNVADPRAWAFNELNVVDRSGSFYISFGLGVDTSVAQPVFKSEINQQYLASPVELRDLDGLEVVDLAAENGWTPVVDPYLSDLDRSVQLPRELTLDELKPLLAGAGLDVDATLLGLLPQLAPEDLQSLVTLAAVPVPLDYLQRFEGRTGLDPVTGAPVHVVQVNEVLGAVPSSTWVDGLAAILDRYPAVPEAVALVTAVRDAAASPIPIFANTYQQTDASVASAVADAKENGRMLNLAQSVVPNGLLLVGLVLTVLGLVLIAIPRRGEGGFEPETVTPPPTPAEDADEPDEAKDKDLVWV
jgi:hypothetical protein